MSLIVILDDRGTNRRILARLAASVEAGAEVMPFSNPVEMLDWMDENRPDLVITDYRMPQMDGAEVAARIRAKPNGADVPVVVVTAYDDPEPRLRALDSGATDFLITPVDHFEFRSRIRNLLALRRHQVRLRDEAQDLARELESSERSRLALIRESRKSLGQVIDTVPALISATDKAGRLVLVNARQAAQANATAPELVGHPLSRMVGEARAAQSLAADARVFGTARPIPSFEEDVLDAAGSRRTLLTTKSPLLDADDEVTAVLTTSVDITERKRAEERLLFLSRHDPLTGLANRSVLAERLEESCLRPEHRFALLFLDLDRFKGVNDVLGHQAGDRLLTEVALRLSEAVGDEAMICRLGGDEFAVLRPGMSSSREAEGLARRLLAALEQPFALPGRTVSTSASIGITLFPDDGDRADGLLRNADLAMYRAKAEGRSGFRFFESYMDRAAREALQVEGDLRLALARGEFELHWQPQCSLRTGRMTGAEALLRWQHPERGLLNPGHFLATAEETGLMAPITRWVLDAACRQGAEWSRRAGGPIRVGVNLSPSLFRGGGVLELVEQSLAEAGLAPELLEIELTERDRFEDEAAVLKTLSELRSLGVRLAIDDFGIGYSSLLYARRLPVHRLKIDQSFIALFPGDRSDAAIVGSVISLAHELGMEVVAEGVENRAQLEALRTLGCDEVQGFFIGRPVPADRLDPGAAEARACRLPA
ncbi:EAL domain-containing response regulator [Sabulicella rubraurantiaca]|uniref:EAL domain-containing response regulator n=1 Tax=Sabulicella rubraurantiaca TaxID=2811429 RepID=UPI001A971860|nr:EAL domain-containing protein [Sabulicella rubraurantiaca]